MFIGVFLHFLYKCDSNNNNIMMKYVEFGEDKILIKKTCGDLKRFSAGRLINDKRIPQQKLDKMNIVQFLKNCGGRGGRSGTVCGRSPSFFGVLPKRSIPKPDQHKRYYTTRVVRH